MSFLDAFLGPRGRIDRRTFWLAAGALYLGSFVVALVVAIPILMIFGSQPRSAALASAVNGAVIVAALLFPACSAVSRRLHDFGQSAWLAAPIAIAFVAGYLLPDVLKAAGADAALVNRVDTVGLWALGLVGAALVGAGLIPGHAGANRHGPPSSVL